MKLQIEINNRTYNLAVLILLIESVFIIIVTAEFGIIPAILDGKTTISGLIILLPDAFIIIFLGIIASNINCICLLIIILLKSERKE